MNLIGAKQKETEAQMKKVKGYVVLVKSQRNGLMAQYEKDMYDVERTREFSVFKFIGYLDLSKCKLVTPKRKGKKK